MPREKQGGMEHNDNIPPPDNGHPKKIGRREFLVVTLAGLAGACASIKTGTRKAPPDFKDSRIEKKPAIEKSQRELLEEKIRDLKSQIFSTEKTGPIVPDEDVLIWDDELIKKLGEEYFKTMERVAEFEAMKSATEFGKIQDNPRESPLLRSGLKQDIERFIKTINETLPPDCAISDIQIINYEEGIRKSDGSPALRSIKFQITFTDGRRGKAPFLMAENSNWRDAKVILLLITLKARQIALEHQLMKMGTKEGR